MAAEQGDLVERFRKYYTVSLGNYAVQKEYFPNEEVVESGLTK